MEAPEAQADGGWKRRGRRLMADGGWKRRAAVSIPSNIAEGKGRGSDADYKHFLKIARGSCYELETQLEICKEIGYLKDSETEKAYELCYTIARLINGLIRSLP